MGLGSTKRINTYVGNGSNDTYAYQFKIFTKYDLGVYTRSSTDTSETKLTLDSDYTVSGAGEDAGGTITLSSNLADGSTLVIVRDIPIKQELSIKNQDDYYPNVHEAAFDKLAMIDQSQQVDIDRCIKIALTNVGSVDATLPPVTSSDYSKTIALKSDGSGFEWGPKVSAIDDLDSVAERAELAATNAASSETSAASSATSAAASAVSTAADVTYVTEANSRLSFVLTSVKTGAYTASWGEIVRVDADAGDVTITLPASSTGGNGYRVGVKKVTHTTNTVTVAANGTETIDDSSTYTMEGPYEEGMFVTDGSGDISVMS